MAGYSGQHSCRPDYPWVNMTSDDFINICGHLHNIWIMKLTPLYGGYRVGENAGKTTRFTARLRLQQGMIEATTRNDYHSLHIYV